MTNSWNTPVEALENQYPLRVRRYQIRRRVGRDRAPCGGDGLIREIEFLTPCEVTILSDRRERGSLRLMRRPARTAGTQHADQGKHKLKLVPLAAKANFHVCVGDVLRIETPVAAPGAVRFFEAAGRFRRFPSNLRYRFRRF